MQKRIIDSYLGTIEYSKDLDLYEGKIEIENSESITFRFDVDNNLEQRFKVARNIVQILISKHGEFKQYIAEQLLDLYNNNWSKEETIDRKEFANRIILEAVTIYDDNSAEICYQDGNLFAGHYIVVDLNSKGILDEPYLAG